MSDSIRMSKNRVRAIMSLPFFYVKEVMDLSKLTLKQQRFADEYIISGNATVVAIKAGYSKKTSYSMGQEKETTVFTRLCLKPQGIYS